jgi:hypothetical protein
MLTNENSDVKEKVTGKYAGISRKPGKKLQKELN